jgi:ATP-dependent Lon protease
MPLFDSTFSLSDKLEDPSTAEEEQAVVEIQELIEGEVDSEENDIPQELPILPVRGMVMYPLTQIPITVGQPRSTRLVEDAVLTEPRIIGIVTSKEPEEDEPGPDQVYDIGTAVSLRHLRKSSDGTILLFVQGLERIQIKEYTQTEPYLKARIAPLPEQADESVELEALMRNIVDLFSQLVALVPYLSEEVTIMVQNIDDPRQLAYFVATALRMEIEDAQDILEIDDVTEKLRLLTSALGRELEVLELGKKIQKEAQGNMEKVQREYFLREQLKAIQRELGEEDEQTVEIEEYRRKIQSCGMPEEAEKEALRELSRMEKMPTAAAEYSVIKTYLDWMVNLPWSAVTDDNLDIDHARKVLDEDHYGLQDIKERILEFLAVRKLRQEREDEREQESTGADLIRREREGVILCFIGPPGVGKTSLGRSIARAMGRKFIRQSLGGIRDEAEIRGFRRTYVGSMPGRIIQALRRIGSKNPVFMLDEVDKIGSDWRGDPSSALLEVLDPEQNNEFRDHYLDVPFDLSQVMFICTANQLSPIPGPLRDRMEIINLDGYTEHEKVEIARQYLVPRQIKENGLLDKEIAFTDDAIRRIIREYTYESGVRNLEREIGGVCRKVTTHVAEGHEGELTEVESDDIPKYLGKRKYFLEEIDERTHMAGLAVGLVVTVAGGDITFVEATKMSGNRGLTLTGKLGDVMQESAQAAMGYVRSRADAFGIDDEVFAENEIHIHVPAGAVPKDGPSAGVTMATALLSLLIDQPVADHVAMTGEITLLGRVLPVGGVKQKVLAAARAGMRKVILPKRNQADLDDLPDEVREKLDFVLVDQVDQVFDAAFANGVHKTT